MTDSYINPVKATDEQVMDKAKNLLSSQNSQDISETLIFLLQWVIQDVKRRLILRKAKIIPFLMELSYKSEIPSISSSSWLLIIALGDGCADKSKRKEETIRSLTSLAEVDDLEISQQVVECLPHMLTLEMTSLLFSKDPKVSVMNSEKTTLMGFFKELSKILKESKTPSSSKHLILSFVSQLIFQEKQIKDVTKNKTSFSDVPSIPSGMTLSDSFLPYVSPIICLANILKCDYSQGYNVVGEANALLGIANNVYSEQVIKNVLEEKDIPLLSLDKEESFPLKIVNNPNTSKYSVSGNTITLNVGNSNISLFLDYPITSGVYRCEWIGKHNGNKDLGLVIGITDSGHICNMFNTYMGSQPKCVCFVFYSAACFCVGNTTTSVPDYANSDGVVIAVEVDMNKKTVHFFRGEAAAPFHYHATGLPSSVHFGICGAFQFEFKFISLKKLSSPTVVPNSEGLEWKL